MQQSFDSNRFRQALGAFTTGVTIVTTVDAAGKPVGVTANSFNSVSLAPPMVLWSLARTSANIGTFLAARHFAVHILASDQQTLATRFSQKGTDRFAGLKVGSGIDGRHDRDAGGERAERLPEAIGIKALLHSLPSWSGPGQS